ncbi:50S ribosomal protein L6 [Candidatus Poriferisodalis sp.]|uniref:50S ribosomal protein L6 n=1 Tax=Candidatus Poriferisodalis sp. TaxID=3101277 RepID=UPI003B027CD2
MSRVGRTPISIPDGVTVTAQSASGDADSAVGQVVSVTGPGGKLTQSLAAGIRVRLDDGPEGSVAVVECADASRTQRSLHGLSRALVANMVQGVSQGFSKELQIVGVGYRAAAKGPNALELSLGFSHAVPFTAPEGISFDVPSQTSIVVKGIDKQLVGQVAANIRALRKPEPYKGKGIRYVDERVLRKAGKAAK